MGQKNKIKPVKISHFQRKTIGKVFSLESIGTFIRRESSQAFKYEKKINYFYSVGLVRRILDSIIAIFRQGNINHVMGDIHYIATFLNSKKTIITIADCVSLRRLKGIRQFIIWFFWYYIPVKRAAKIIVISDFVKNELMAYVTCDPNKIRVIHVPVLCAVNERKVCQNSDFLNFLHIGSTDNKNLQRHVKAIKDIPGILNFVGEPSPVQLSFLKSNCLNYKIFSNLTNDEIIVLYDSCDLLLFASTYEGFGMPIIEAQSRGLPVITGNICSMPEVAGNGACLVDPYNVCEIKSAVNKVINDQVFRENLVREGFNNILRFKPSLIAEEYDEVYREIINKNS